MQNERMASHPSTWTTWQERIEGVEKVDGYPGAGLHAELMLLRDFVRWEAEEGDNPIAQLIQQGLTTI